MAREYVGEQPGANLYGCTPCPQCRRSYRFPMRRLGALVVQCDDCNGMWMAYGESYECAGPQPAWPSTTAQIRLHTAHSRRSRRGRKQP
jgi:Zn-finger nucleic acid-binding protein